MSYQTEAILFYGILLTSPPPDEPHDPLILVSHFGHDGDATHFAAVKSSMTEAELGRSVRVNKHTLTVLREWDKALRAYANREGIPWPEGGAAWRMAASRF